MNTPNNLEWLTKAMADFVHKINNNPETSNYIGLSEDTAAFKALEQTIATMIANQVREARQDALNNWTYKIIGRIQGKELLFADDVREEVQKRIEGLQND